MKIKHIIISLVLPICWNTIIQAQSLDNLIAELIEQSPELKALNQEYLAALEKAPQVSQLPDPEVGIGTFLLPVETRLGAQSVRLSLGQMFPWFGTLESRAKLENTRASVVYERIAARALDLTYSLKDAYLRLYEIQESQAILQRSISLLEALERLALAKVESGTASTADVLRVQLKTTELKQELEILETSKTVPLATINQLMNRPLETPVLISDSLSFATLVFDKDSLEARIKAQHPMLRMFELQQAVSMQALEVNKLAGKPAFSIGLDYTVVDQRTDAMPENNGRDIVQLRAGISIPINRKKYQAKEREENFLIEAIDHKKTDLTNGFLAAIEKAFATYDTARLKTSLYEQQKNITESAINILEAEYSTSGTGFDELLRLEQELIEYDLKLLKATVQSHLAKAGIERYLVD